MDFKRIVKSIFSDKLISRITGFSYGWRGNYSSWNMAKAKCKGYEEKLILDKVFINASKVKNGEIPYERDGVAFEKKVYSFPVLAGLLWISGQNNNKLKIIDFGGSLGTSYYQNLFFLNSLSEVNWCIVEQQHFVKIGIESFADNRLHFFNSIDDCLKLFNINAVLLSGVVQYLEKPYDLLDEIISKKIQYILIDRTLFIEKKDDRLTVQKVPSRIYKASYCCWFLSESKFLNLISEHYNLIFDFYIDENINIRSLYKGYLFKLK